MEYADILVKHFIQLNILHKVRPCLQKLDTGFCTYGFVSLLAPIGPKVILRPKTPKASFLHHVKLNKILHKPLFLKIGWFLTKLWGFISRVLQKNHQKVLFLVPLQVWSSPLTLVHKTPLFWNTKMQISLEPLVQI